MLVKAVVGAAVGCDRFAVKVRRDEERGAEFRQRLGASNRLDDPDLCRVDRARFDGTATSRFLIPFLRWLKPDISPETLAQIQF